MVLTERIAVIKQYVKSIRNEGKKAYAMAYADYLVFGHETEPVWGKISYMAAQAVRNRLCEIWRAD